MADFVLLLRGINLGAHNRIGMAELRAALEGAGFTDVVTVLASGNAIVSSSGSAATVARDAAAAIDSTFGTRIEVVVRTRRQLCAVVEADVLGDVADHGSRRFVVFCERTPSAAALRPLLDGDWGADRFEAHGSELYLWCADGISSGRLGPAFGAAKLGVAATTRNWNTVLRLRTKLGERA